MRITERCSRELEADAARNAREVQRIRRENVTEMILEPVPDFARDSFCEACEGAEAMGPAEMLETATRLEARADRYYVEAAEKLKSLTEVSRALRTPRQDPQGPHRQAAGGEALMKKGAEGSRAQGFE